MASASPDYLAAAWIAAPAFDLAPEAIDLLSHSENVVCDLTMSDGNHLVMRLHRPGYNALAELESEVQWVAALRESGVPVPTAVPTTDGSFYTTVDLDGQAVHVGVVEWVDGAPLGAATEAGGSEVVKHYHRIGELSAQIRLHNGNWTPPDSFVRRRWDASGLVGESPIWGRFWEVEALSREQQVLFAEARAAISDQLSCLPMTDEFFGLIHADLHLGNLMADGDQLTIIDFDDAGFGWFAHELAVSLHPVLDEPWFADARAALLAGYRRVYPLGVEEEGWIDTFLTMRWLMIIGWLDARREVPIYEQFDELAAQAEATTRRYLSGS